MTRADPPPLERAWYAAAIAATSGVAAGTLVLLFAAGPRTFAWILVGFFAVSTAWSTAVAVIAYRRIMRRPWPEVAPLPDDDWDD